MGSWLMQASDRSLSCLQCAACTGTHNFPPQSAQTQPHVQVSFLPYSQCPQLLLSLLYCGATLQGSRGLHELSTCTGE